MVPYDEIAAVDEIIRNECPADRFPTQAFMTYIGAMVHGPHDPQLSDRDNYELKYRLAVREMRQYMNGDRAQAPEMEKLTRLTDAA